MGIGRLHCWLLAGAPAPPLHELAPLRQCISCCPTCRPHDVCVSPYFPLDRRSVSVTAPFYSGTNVWGRRLSSSDGANVGVNVNVPGSSGSGGSGSSSSGNNNNNNRQGQGQSQQQQQGQQGQTAVNVKAPYTDVGVDAGKSGRCVGSACLYL